MTLTRQIMGIYIAPRFMLLASVVSLFACVDGRSFLNDGGVNKQPAGADGDFDEDGVTPRQGDCDDSQALINPGAVEMVGNGVDDDCNDQIDETTPPCSIDGKAVEPDKYASAMELCDARFVRAVKLVSSDSRARKVVTIFGNLAPRVGENMTLFSTGIAADKSDANYVPPQYGSKLGPVVEPPVSLVTFNPAPNLPGVVGCAQEQPKFVFDAVELEVKLKAPTNARNFSFDFYFMSAEYPEFVCSKYNDEFLVSMESSRGTADTVAYDSNKNPITVNNGFFTVCENYLNSRTQHCKTGIAQLNGTGYEDAPPPVPNVIPPANIGGGTGWLSTTVPVVPGEEFTIYFRIFDQGDNTYDSAVLLDNFHWGGQVIETPITIQ